MTVSQIIENIISIVERNVINTNNVYDHVNVAIFYDACFDEPWNVCIERQLKKN